MISIAKFYTKSIMFLRKSFLYSHKYKTSPYPIIFCNCKYTKHPFPLKISTDPSRYPSSHYVYKIPVFGALGAYIHHTCFFTLPAAVATETGILQIIEIFTYFRVFLSEPAFIVLYEKRKPYG